MKIFLHGFATTPALWPDGGPALKFDDIQREAERIGQGLGTGSALVGWSMSGMMAILTAVKFPEKIGELILVSTTPKFLSSDDYAAGISPALLKRLAKQIRAGGTKAFHSLVFKSEPASGLAHPPFAEARAELEELGRVDLRRELSKIKAPTLIIHGDRDEICLPEAAHYLHEHIAGSRLIMLEGVGHAPMVEAPEKFYNLINNHAG